MTDFHAKYFAYELSKRCSANSIEKLASTLADAQVEPKPHQIDAALFAFKSPLSKGAILADEVGLRKTIEAGIVISQKWAERKRKILIIVPSTLRKQWHQELLEKFFLHSIILESKSFNDYIKQGIFNPFLQNEIIITSYNFVRNKDSYVKSISWDLVIIDEAHRLRNVYKNSNKIAKSIKDSLSQSPKILLTATPLQNSLLELYGLVSFIDEYTFGNIKSFKSQFSKLSDDRMLQFNDLKNRLAPVCKRTLRKQVNEYINYTNRKALTQEFYPTDDEQRLYDSVTAYLQKTNLMALPSSQRLLMTLILRKLLSSSSFAIAGTLRSLVNKLKDMLDRAIKNNSVEDMLQDFEGYDDLLDETEDDYEEEDKSFTQEQINAIKAEIDELEEIGYETLYSPDISPEGDYSERQDYSVVLLEARLKDSLRYINPQLPEEAIEGAYRQIAIPQSPGLVVNNKDFHKLVTDGVDVSYRQKDGSIKNDKAWLFDFNDIDMNEWLVVNQFTVIENRVEKRPDVVVFVNGIPLAVFELKSSSNEDVEITDAYNQLQTYKMTIPSLFTYNEILVISDGLNARAGSLTADEDRFMMWRTIDGLDVAPAYIPQLEVLIKGMFNKGRFLDLIRQFILFQTDGADTFKILAAYHQYHAVNKALDSTIRATQESGDRRIGVIWHTQGSGKSLTMVFYVGKLVLSEEMSNPTVIVITDRNDLDNQLFGTFRMSKDLIRSEPQQAEDRSHLRSLLNNRTSSGIIFTTIQKFAPEEKGDSLPVLTDRKNVIVIADEAHRSQYGFAADVVSSENEADIKYGYAKYMRDALPNASYIGFTGTPIALTDKNTEAVFGDCIDIYDMTRSVEDGTTVKIYYESRLAKLDLPDELKPVIDDEYNDITEYQEYSQKEQLKTKWSRLEAIVGADERVNVIAKDIVDHFEKRQSAQVNEGGKGMVVAMSRRIAIDLYKAIVNLRPDWHSDDLMKGKIKVVMTGASSDPPESQKFIGTKATRKTLEKRMRDRNDELQLVIVRDMWLTGFDVPSLHTMYIDKPMQGHNLMQAIARVNRVFNEKQGGLVVDYIGIAENLKEALSKYTKNDQETTGVDTNVAAEILLEKYYLIKELLHGHDYSKFFSGSSSEKMQAIVETIDYVIGLRDNRKDDYIQFVNELTKAYSLCATTEVAERLNVEVGFHKSVKLVS